MDAAMNGNEIMEIANAYTQYDMITAHTDLPDFPHHRINLLDAFLRNGALKSGEDEQHHQLYALAISLMQIGLDTHDMVGRVNDPTDERKMRSNQLRVLAGDYFSSRFYELLAKQGRIEFIALIAQAICDLNAMKLKFYMSIQEKRMTAEQFLQQSIHIKMQLFLPFSRMMNDNVVEKWESLLHSLTHCEVIAEQIERCSNEASEQDSWIYWYKKQNVQAKHAKDTLREMLANQYKKLQAQIKQVSNETMFKQLSQIGESFLKYLEAPQIRQGI